MLNQGQGCRHLRVSEFQNVQSQAGSPEARWLSSARERKEQEVSSHQQPRTDDLPHASQLALGGHGDH